MRKRQYIVVVVVIIVVEVVAIWTAECGQEHPSQLGCVCVCELMTTVGDEYLYLHVCSTQGFKVLCV